MDRKIKDIGTVALRAVILMALSAALSALCRFVFVENMFGEDYFSEQILNVWHFVFFIMIFYSLTFALDQHDKRCRARLLAQVKDGTLLSVVKFTLLSVDLYTELAVITVVSVLLPASFLYGFVGKAFFNGTAQTNGLYTLFIILPIMFALLFTARLKIGRSWYASARRSASAEGKKPKLPPVVKSVFNTALVYVGASIVLPWFLPGVITLYNVGGPWLFLWVLIGLASVIAVVTAVFYARAIIKRRSFVNKLRRYCRDNSVYLSDIRKPVASVFSMESGYDFSVKKDGVQYDCKFIAGVFPTSVFIFSDRGNGLKQDTFHLLRAELFHFMTKFDFGYESHGKKILVLLPTPKRFFVSVNDAPPRPADVGERVGQYTIYNSTGFINALERDTLQL